MNSKSAINRESARVAIAARFVRRAKSSARISARLKAPAKTLKPERVAQLKKLGKL